MPTKVTANRIARDTLRAITQEPKVVVILLNWNNGHFTAPCIRSLEKSKYSDMHILVVDNGSEDGSPEALRKDFPEATLIRNSQNLMNPPNLIWFAGSRVNLWTGSCKHVGYGETDHGQFDAMTEPGFATGCCFLVRADLLKKLGGFEESFFIYSEDADFSLRCRKAGYRIVFNPRAKLWHKESGTMAKNTRNGHRAKPTPLQHYLIARNGIFVVRRHASLVQKVIAYPICTLRVTKRLLQRLLERDWDSTRSLARALWEGFRTECSSRQMGA